MVVCGNTCQYYSLGDCSKALSDNVKFVETIIDSIAHPIDIDIVLAKECLFKLGLEETLSAIINLIRLLTEHLWDLHEYSYEQTTDETIAGCFAKHPLV